MQSAPTQQQGYPAMQPTYMPAADPYQQQPPQAYPAAAAPVPAGPYSYAAAVAQSGAAQGTAPAAGQAPAPPPGYPGTGDMTQAPAEGGAEGDGTRGLGTMLMNTGHSVAHTGHKVHLLAHPGQYIKYHTVGKVRAKVHQAVGKALNKVGM